MTRTATESFTLTNSKILASKVTTDMLRCQQAYGRPTNSEINDYGTELALMLRDGYVEEYEFGFQQDGQRVVSWLYRVKNGQLISANDRPGRIDSDADISRARFFNFMRYSSTYSSLTSQDKENYRRQMPIVRPDGQPPSDGAGYWSNDLTYSSGGVALARSTFHPNKKL